MWLWAVFCGAFSLWPIRLWGSPLLLGVFCVLQQGALLQSRGRGCYRLLSVFWR